MRSLARGAVFIEVLVTATIVAIGILGLAQVQARTTIATFESQQRTQGLLLARDMADRLIANRPNAAAYVASDYGATPTMATPCDTATAAGRDRCAWNAALKGANERIGAVATGGLRNGRGCVLQSGPRRYQVVVTWQGMLPTVAPATGCGRGVDAAERYRRAVTLPIDLPDLAGA